MQEKHVRGTKILRGENNQRFFCSNFFWIVFFCKESIFFFLLKTFCCFRDGCVALRSSGRPVRIRTTWRIGSSAARSPDPSAAPVRRPAAPRARIADPKLAPKRTVFAGKMLNQLTVMLYQVRILVTVRLTLQQRTAGGPGPDSHS